MADNKNQLKFTKEQIVNSKKLTFMDKLILETILEDREYNLEEVDELLKKFKEKKVDEPLEEFKEKEVKE